MSVNRCNFFNLNVLTHKHQEMYGCKLSTVDTDVLVLKHAEAPGHQYPQCWPNITCIDQFHTKIFHSVIVHDIRK